MAAKVTPYFILTAEGCFRSKNDEFINQDDIQMSLSKCTSFTNTHGHGKKFVTLTRNEVTRKRMDAIRQSLEDSRARLKQQVNPKEKNGSVKSEPPVLTRSLTQLPGGKSSNHKNNIDKKEMVEIVPFNLMEKNEIIPKLPYVYFVVSQKKKKEHDFQTLLDDNFFREIKQNRETVSRGFPSSKDSEQLKMKQIVNELGLKSDLLPLKIHHRHRIIPDKIMIQNASRKPLITNAFLDGENNFVDYENISKHNDTISKSIGACEEQKSSIPKQCSPQLIELPDITFETHRKILGSSTSSDFKIMESKNSSISESPTRKLVHFNVSYDLPIIRGNGIPIVSCIPPVMVPRASTMPIIQTHKEKEKEKNAQITDRSKTSLVAVSLNGKRNNLPLNLPKIDIVSGVYDELIVKAISNYAKEFPASSKQGKIARQLLNQLQEQKISTSDIANLQIVQSMKSKRHGKIRIKEVSDIATVDERKTGNRISKHDKTTKEINTITPTCFKMAPPGVLPSGSVDKSTK